MHVFKKENHPRLLIATCNFYVSSILNLVTQHHTLITTEFGVVNQVEIYLISAIIRINQITSKFS